MFFKKARVIPLAFFNIMKNKNNGFTLVEIMIVVAIIAMLAAIAIPNLLRARVNSNDTAALALLKSICTSLETYAAANNGLYPLASGLSALAGHTFANSTPPYFNKEKLTTPQFGHDIIFAGSTAGYQIAANVSNDNVSGSKNYRMSTWCRPEVSDCTGADYTVSAP